MKRVKTCERENTKKKITRHIWTWTDAFVLLFNWILIVSLLPFYYTTIWWKTTIWLLLCFLVFVIIFFFLTSMRFCYMFIQHICEPRDRKYGEKESNGEREREKGRTASCIGLNGSKQWIKRNKEREREKNQQRSSASFTITLSWWHGALIKVYHSMHFIVGNCRLCSCSSLQMSKCYHHAIDLRFSWLLSNTQLTRGTKQPIHVNNFI